MCKLTIKNERSDEHKNLFLPEKIFPNSESYIFKNLIKFPKL